MGEMFETHQEFNVCTGARYIGAYGEMGDKHSCVHKKSGEKSSEKLRHDGLCNQNGVAIFTTRNKRYRTGVQGIEIFLLEFFCLVFYLEDQKPSLQF